MSKHDCIEFSGYKDRAGYGILPGGKRAHREIYRQAFGDFNQYLFVCHKCDNPSCINPKHLFLGTALDNNQDKASKGRSSKVSLLGETNPMAKLTRADAEKIKKMYKSRIITQAKLAMKFGITQSTVWSILNGRTWK
jgi:hypothetical protein